MFSKDIKILICDDTVLSRTLIKSELVKEGYENIVEAVNGKIAVDLITDNGNAKAPTVDFLFLDINMPEMNGLEVINHLKAMSGFETLPIVIVSTESEKSLIVEAISLGVNNFIEKPYTPGTIITKMQEVWDKLQA